MLSITLSVTVPSERFPSTQPSLIPVSHVYDDSLKCVISHMKANMSVTWTVAELYNIYTENAGHLTRKQMLLYLTEYFGEEIVVLHLEGCSSVVGFRKFVGKTLKLVKLSETSDVDDDVDRLVRRSQEHYFASRL